ncbi:MAG: gamma-glutamyl-gamma-aminobutyrate hydrolase family protein [Maridesulfovibrio sp.]
MRNSDASEYYEPRDGIAASWGDFLSSALPEAAWVALPNIGNSITKTLKDFAINALILSGGENYGENPKRDKTEIAALDFCISKQIPVIGICRGLQVIQTYFGGRILNCDSNKHVATRHNVNIAENIFLPTDVHEVNSFHSNGIHKDYLAAQLTPLALDDEDLVEAAYSFEHKLAGIMWHPEREKIFKDLDCRIFDFFFENCQCGVR